MTAGFFGLVVGEFSTNELPNGERAVELKNIHLKDLYINVSTRYETFIGGLVGNAQNGIYIDNCYALGNVTGNAENNKVHIGGFAGQAGGIHYNCYAKGDVISLKTTTDVGAISGRLGRNRGGSQLLL